MNEQELRYSIALTLVPGIGPVLAKKLLDHFGSAEEVFRKIQSSPQIIQGISAKIRQAFLEFNGFEKAEEEVMFLRKNNIQAIGFYDENYPYRLRRNRDAPLLLYFKGSANLNHHRIISMVGTRRCTEYGISFCKKFISELVKYRCHVISGLAYGIDIQSHKAALNHGICTIGVVAHGLDELYPAAHRETANKMIKNGGILTEYPTNTAPKRENFPSRNRIVAGLCDATIIVESEKKGGAMITAQLAGSYNRDVFAVPGRCSDPRSAGPNDLIRNNMAGLLESADDLAHYMNWDIEQNTPDLLSKASELNETEQKIAALFTIREQWHIDELYAQTGISAGDLSLTLLELELKGKIKTLAGNLCRWQP